MQWPTEVQVTNFLILLKVIDSLLHRRVVQRLFMSTDMLFKEELTSDVLLLLRELTLCDNLVPKFSAMLPQCWVEVQQEQQQRQHPQHLHQHGDSSHHTRSWHLNCDR